VKIHNVSIEQAALEFNTNYRTLSRYCKKVLNIWLSILKHVTINSGDAVVIFSQFSLKLNNLFVW